MTLRRLPGFASSWPAAPAVRAIANMCKTRPTAPRTASSYRTMPASPAAEKRSRA